MTAGEQIVYTVGMKCGGDPYKQLVSSGFPNLDLAVQYVRDHCSAQGRPAPSQPEPSSDSWVMHSGDCTYLIETQRKRQDPLAE